MSITQRSSDFNNSEIHNRNNALFPPLGVGDTKLVLRNNERDEQNAVVQRQQQDLTITEVEQEDDSDDDDDDDVGSNEIALPVSSGGGGITANVHNSTDVTIAENLTHINGPVTIYQTINGHANGGYQRSLNSDSQNDITTISTTGTSAVKSQFIPYPVNNESETNVKSNLFNRTTIRKSTVVIFIILVILITISIATYFTVFHNSTTKNTPEQDSDSPEEDLGNEIQFIPRRYWAVRPPRNPIKYSTKPSMVIIKHTGDGNCNDFRTCASIMAALQSFFVSTENASDIGYHFAIGGDGNVYEGRGWDVRGDYGSKSLSICYLGNFVNGYDVPTKKMIDAGKAIIAKGESLGKLSEDYVVVNHNQTWNTLSPGENLVKEVKQWPHYSNGLYFT